MKPQRQPKKSKLCGKVAVQILTGKPITEIMEAFNGDHGKTPNREIVRVLKAFGYTVTESRLNGKPLLELPSIIKLKWPKPLSSGFHWVAYDGTYIYDPLWGERYDLFVYEAWIKRLNKEHKATGKDAGRLVTQITAVRYG